MWNKKTFTITNNWKERLIKWSATYTYVCFLDSNGYYEGNKYKNYDALMGVAMKDAILGAYSMNFLKNNLQNDWAFGFLSYDLKNEIEQLSSDNPDGINMPVLHFFHPEIIFEINKNEVTIHHRNDCKDEDLEQLFVAINNFEMEEAVVTKPIIRQRVEREDYLATIEKIRTHIALGDIYEMNYCMEFFVEDFTINPYLLFNKLNVASPTPFASFYKVQNKFLMCASPERFLLKKGNRIISQPIKGTIRRDLENATHDEQLKQDLFNDAKERAENVMIVDLVRNDLSRTAKKGTVKVEELFGIYSFRQVHQMISTISSVVKEDVRMDELLRTTFPMGSMTGAPKIRAMQLIEELEKTKRGLYSGSVGYVMPNGDFDFNVVIRSIQYNAEARYLSFMVGSAITFDSVGEKEYEECLLKAKAIMAVLV